MTPEAEVVHWLELVVGAGAWPFLSVAPPCGTLLEVDGFFVAVEEIAVDGAPSGPIGEEVSFCAVQTIAPATATATPAKTSGFLPNLEARLLMIFLFCLNIYLVF